MATAWPQGAQPPTQNNGIQYSSSAPPPQRKSTNPPPVCYLCEGPHFVKDCPQGPRPTASSFPQPPPQSFQQYTRPAPPVQAYPPQPGPPQPSYTSYPQNQHYVTPGPQPAYNQPPQQPYTAPPVSQYGRPGYQPPPYSQYPQPNGPPHYGGPGYQAPPQQYVPPAAAPYQPLNPYAQPSAAYGGPQQGPPVPYQTPLPQWNTPPSSRPPFQQVRRSASFQQREFSASSTQESQPQQQLDYGPEAPKQAPQTSASSHGGLQHGTRPHSHSSPATAAAESKVASAASTPRNQQLPNVGLVRKESTHSLVSDGQVSETKVSEGKEGEDAIRVESETPTPEDEDAQFDWDLKYIFKDPERRETVALAQPLSANFKSTPVPLVQAWSILIPSISRYARKDNEKEFTRSIRHAPQWSFLQEDPGFSDDPLEGPLIPLSEVHAWTAARHRITTPEPELEQEFENKDGPDSRKRLRSEEQEEGQIDEQDDMDYHSELEASKIDAKGPRIKRQKNEEDEGQLDEVMGMPTTRTPVLMNGRAGTPCLETDDDAWAPEAGERAASPMDPTEALLASLGVSGSPKPVKQDSLPPYAATNEENQSPQAQPPAPSQQTQQDPNVPPPNVTPSHGLPMDDAYGNTSQTNHQWDSPANTPQGKPQWNPPVNTPQGASTPQAQPQWGPPTNTPYGPPTNTQYGNDPPTGPPGPPTNQPYVNSQYGPHTNPPYGNGPSPYAAPINQHYGPSVSAPYGPQNGYQHGPPQSYGPPQTPSYGNALPYNAPQPYPQQYGPPVNFQQGPLQYAQPAAPYGPPSNFPQGAPQYPSQRTPSFGNGPPASSTYGAPPQSSPIQYGPPLNPPYNTHPNPLQQYGSNGPQGPYPNGPQPNAPYQNSPPVQPPYSNAPPRQDSGYASARGSYSNGSGPPEHTQQNATHDPAQPVPQNDPSHSPQGFGETQYQDQKENNQRQQLDRRSGAEEGSADATNSNGTNSTEDEGTPLSPTSAEILGKLVRKDSSGDSSRQKSEASRKIKRPQPVVADAYSRRW
ncbi:hypothetical protein N431DRAFT_441293 [Stipitochalara longipes BDJ]|nr:hypothetical protein N431DRAFT_441293 [Stipitochalara longipes BDJ]